MGRASKRRNSVRGILAQVVVLRSTLASGMPGGAHARDAAGDRRLERRPETRRACEPPGRDGSVQHEGTHEGDAEVREPLVPGNARLLHEA